MSIQSFQAMGNTVAITVNVSGTASTGVTVIGNGSPMNYLISNVSSLRIYYIMRQSIYNADGTFSPSSGTVSNPTTGGNGNVLMPRSQQIVVGPPNATFFGISQAGVLTFYVTPGEGSTI